MPFSHIPLFGNPFENTGAVIERQARLRLMEMHEETEAEFADAEVDPAIRRAAMVRERLRRLGLR